MKRSVVIHPFLFAVYPIAYLVAYNIDQLLLIDRFSLASVFAPMGISLFLAASCLAILSLILRNADKAGILVSASLLLFFSYGHIYNIVDRWMAGSAIWVGNFVIGPYKFVFFIWCTLFGVIALFTIITRKGLRTATGFLNFVSGCLVAISVINIAGHELRKADIWKAYGDGGKEIKEATNTGRADRRYPDIYYIILDGYTSSKKLAQIYNYDNTGFTGYLAQKGFYVAKDSRSNYAQTTHSLASTLNMEYINYVTDVTDSKYSPMGTLYLKLRNNRVVRFLKERGYKYIHFASAYGLTENNKFADMEFHLGKGNEFYIMLINTTMLKFFEKYFIINDSRKRILDTFGVLSKMHEIDGPKFVFAHLVIPHPPFYFDKDGNPPPSTTSLEKKYKNEWSNKDAYISQLLFVNKKIRGFVDGILFSSDTAPVIILQGDRGTCCTFGGDNSGWDNPAYEMMNERMSIFNAYYLPDAKDTPLYAGISPLTPLGCSLTIISAPIMSFWMT